jgi:TM2 domain-containing membrane protein YozV
LKLKMLILLLMFCSISAIPEAPDYYSPESILLFADHLFRQQDYLRAAYEYERYTILQNGTDPAAREIMLRAGKAFQCAGRYDRSLDLFAEILKTVEQERIRERAVYETGLSYFLMSRYEKSLLFLRDQPAAAQSPDCSLLIGADLMMLGRWQQAEEALDGHGFPANESLPDLAEPTERPKPTERAELAELAELAHEGSTMRRKSPLAAAFLSALVPGTGKIYAGEYGDGIHSLVFIGLFGTLSALSFRADGWDSVRGWIYASVGGVLYGGNIYGSVVSARRYNRLREEALLLEVRQRIPQCSEFALEP